MRFRLDLTVDVEERGVKDEARPFKYIVNGSMAYQRGSEYGPWERVPFSNWTFETVSEDEVDELGGRITEFAKIRAKEFKALLDKRQEWSGRRGVNGSIFTVD